MLDGTLPTQEAQLLKTLGHPVRLQIVCKLIEKECCVGNLWNNLGLSQAETSRHLALLREAEVVLDRRQGQWIYYRLNPKLPDWAQAVLAQTAEGVAKQMPFSRDHRALCQMPNRPGSACCA